MIARVALCTALLCMVSVTAVSAAEPVPLTSSIIDRILFPNPYAHIPAQCYIETSGGTQNACQYCHTDALAKRRFGNNTPQAGASTVLGNLQAEYAFAALHYPYVVNGSVTPWENTLFPGRLRDAVDAAGQDPAAWDMQAYVRQDNWTAAYAKRPGDPRRWDAGVKDPFRLFPGLDPADLPADGDGFVRSAKTENGFFRDDKGWVTGWRAVNFVPYGIFTPLTGSVSGIYIRLPEAFMKDAAGQYDRGTYIRNLDLVARAVQDRLGAGGQAHYLGAASDAPVEPGLYPLGTEFAHPLHYVDVAADGTAGAPSPYPGTRARRVKEVRYMYKMHPFDPNYGSPNQKEEDAPVRASETEGWIDNGAGWILAAYIEDEGGALRPQTPSELTQCVGCHSGSGRQDEIAYPDFTSGTGNTVDSSWALPRQLAGDAGWREMDVMGYRRLADGGPEAIPGRAALGDPTNRRLGTGEFSHFLETVVGASLFGDMPASVERFLVGRIREGRGYSADWPAIDTTSAEAFLVSQRQRQVLLHELTTRGEYLAQDGTLAGALLYPPARDALAAAARYRQVVATQRYDFGKDVFPETPVTLRYFRTSETAYPHQDGRPYRLGDVITDRPVDTDPSSLTYGVGVAPTLIDENPEAPALRGYEPFLE